MYADDFCVIFDFITMTNESVCSTINITARENKGNETEVKNGRTYVTNFSG